MSTTDRFLVLFIFNGHPKKNEVKSHFILKLKRIWTSCYTKIIKKITKEITKEIISGPTTTPNTLFVFPHQKFQHLLPPLSPNLSKNAMKNIV